VSATFGLQLDVLTDDRPSFLRAVVLRISRTPSSDGRFRHSDLSEVCVFAPVASRSGRDLPWYSFVQGFLVFL
jgi:hypothetical protein